MELPEWYNFNSVSRTWLLYMFSDSIYPPRCIFAKPNHAPIAEKYALYTRIREFVRKEIERFLDVLQGCFREIRYDLHEWSDELIILISQVCVLFHNMIVDMWTRGELR